MSCRTVVLVVFTFATDALGSPAKHHHDSHTATLKVNYHAPAFRTGYMDGYREGANDSAALSNAYRDESGPTYDQALDGYMPQYGDEVAYQGLFRQGYSEGYKAGWDFNSGQFNPLGAGGGGP